MERGAEDFKKILTDLVQKQMVVLGPNIALDKARKVPGLSVGEDGAVFGVSGDPQLVLKAVAGEYAALSGPIAQMVLDSVLKKYSGIKSS